MTTVAGEIVPTVKPCSNVSDQRERLPILYFRVGWISIRQRRGAKHRSQRPIFVASAMKPSTAEMPAMLRPLRCM